MSKKFLPAFRVLGPSLRRVHRGVIGFGAAIDYVTGIGLDRKILADLAVTDEAAFKSIVDQAKSALAEKSKSKKAA